MPKTFECIEESTWNGQLADPGTKITAHTEEAEMALTDHPCWKCVDGKTVIKAKPKQQETPPPADDGKPEEETPPPAPDAADGKPGDKKGGK